MSSITVLVTKPGEAASLALMCESFSDRKAVVIGTRDLAAECARVFPNVQLIEDAACLSDAYAAAAAQLLIDATCEAVLGYATPAVRAALGLVAAKTGAATVSNTVKVEGGAGAFKVDHQIIDNKVIETLDVQGSLCALADTVTFVPTDPEGDAAGSIEVVSAELSPAIALTEAEPIPDSGVDTAQFVVGVGRGVSNQEKFDQAKDLAALLGAELSGSMCGVRDFGYFAEDAPYIGLTGSRLNAKLYIALGISGSTPHLAGIGNAQTVVCNNSDEKAPLFNHSTYGIVAPVEDVVPELISALAK